MDQTSSYLSHVPNSVLARYEFCEVRNAAAIIASTSPDEWNDIVAVIAEFHLTELDITTAGGNKSDVAARLDIAFRKLGWREGRVDTRILLQVRVSPYKPSGEKKPKIVDSEVENKGYKVDNLKSRIALDVEWNAKDGNLDRDVGAYRALCDAALIDAGVIITRTQADLREFAQEIEPGTTKFHTTTTTNLEKLTPRLTRGDGGGCPILAIAICSRTFQSGEEAREG